MAECFDYRDYTTPEIFLGKVKGRYGEVVIEVIPKINYDFCKRASLSELETLWFQINWVELGSDKEKYFTEYTI